MWGLNDEWRYCVRLCIGAESLEGKRSSSISSGKIEGQEASSIWVVSRGIVGERPASWKNGGKFFYRTGRGIAGGSILLVGSCFISECTYFNV